MTTRWRDLLATLRSASLSGGRWRTGRHRLAGRPAVRLCLIESFGPNPTIGHRQQLVIRSLERALGQLEARGARVTSAAHDLKLGIIVPVLGTDRGERS